MPRNSIFNWFFLSLFSYMSTLLLRYYSPKELEGRGVKHVKILTEGRVVPSEGVVHQFYRYFREAFLKGNGLSENPPQGSARNRGWSDWCALHSWPQQDWLPYLQVWIPLPWLWDKVLMCRYMIEMLGWDPEKAIEAFDQSRGHTQVWLQGHRSFLLTLITQERANYLHNLRAKGWERRKRRFSLCCFFLCS